MKGRSRSTSPWWGHKAQRPSSFGRASLTATTPSCARLLSPPGGSSAADLATAVSTAPGTELLTGPSSVTVGGRPAKHVALFVRENVGCDPGFFYTWRDVPGGAFWGTTGVGDTIRVWIVDVDDTRLFIEAETTKSQPRPRAGSPADRRIHQLRIEARPMRRAREPAFRATLGKSGRTVQFRRRSGIAGWSATSLLPIPGGWRAGRGGSKRRRPPAAGGGLPVSTGASAGR